MVLNKLQPHIRISNRDTAKYALLPGDPGRVKRVMELLDKPKELASNREYYSISGYYKGIKLLVLSTGIGGASTGIAIEELHNIGVEVMIRIGSCGSLSTRTHIGDLVLVNGAVRDDGTSKTYIDSIYPAIPDTLLLIDTINSAEQLGCSYQIGKTRSHDSFYTENEEEYKSFWSSKGVLASDMETAALFTIGGLRGIKTASILNTVVEYQGNLENEINSYVEGQSHMLQGESNEINVALNSIYIYEQKNNIYTSN
ncbi:nucleoside phosphorylase [Anaeromicropila herbilytica]|uniref:Uridine phosphorylase n=1 Tax=Anaeromicropila herbilytica TaxID=2785025 RepID=A0A7R7EPS2_9FIRM|nr:nucleoside phosphorylase [Anaeromicropila herbilytica]BCN32480.1 uridine phosphorylase [Anaeromicropila herbilytica]